MSQQPPGETGFGDDERSVESVNYLLPESLDINEIQFSQEDPIKILIESSNPLVNKAPVDSSRGCSAIVRQNEDSSSKNDSNRKQNGHDESGFIEGNNVELSQGDHALITLDIQGELNNVIGSDSVLTQELAMNYPLSQNLSQSASRCSSPTENHEMINVTNDAQQAIDDPASPSLHRLNSNDSCESPYSVKRTNNRIDNNLDSLLTAVHIVGSPDAMRIARKHSMRLRMEASESDNNHRHLPLTRLKRTGTSKSPNREKSMKVTYVNTTNVEIKSSKPIKKLKKRPRDEHSELGLAVVCSPSFAQGKDVTPSTDSSSVIPSPPRSNRNVKSDPDFKLNLDEDDTKTKHSDFEDDVQIAHEAAALAARALKDHNLASRLLLSLILTREKPGKIESIVTNAQALHATADNPYYMPVGFQWCDYPPLEEVLKKYRRQYYELSMDPTLRQTVEQLSFNNRLVALIRQTGMQNHWIFYQKTGNENNTKKGKNRDRDNVVCNNSNHFNWTEKALRDRIRFYYKTNLQNARGRLQTMLKNPSKRSNARNLKELYQLLQNNYAPVKPEQSS